MAFVVPPNLSVIISIWMESVFYGMNFIVYLLCLYVLVIRRKGRGRLGDRLLVLLSTLLFLSATAHMSVNVRRLVEGYVNPPTKEAMTAYLLDITVKSSVAKQYTLVMVNLFSDILITWRVYMVWEMSWKVAFVPALLCAGVFTSGVATAAYEGLVTPGQSIFLKRISKWATTQFSLSLAMNVTATLLIASRIWYVTRELRKFNPDLMRTYWRIIILIVESASLAAVMQVLELAFYEAKFPVIYFIADSTVQIVAMAPLLIIVLVGMTQHGTKSSWGTSYPTSQEITDVRFNHSGIGIELAGRNTDQMAPISPHTEDTQSVGSQRLRFTTVKDTMSTGSFLPGLEKDS